ASAADDPHQVFLIGGNQLTFIDLLTGETETTAVNGERFAVVGDSVMFFDRANRRVMLAASDGTLRAHPFIQPGEGVNRIDWRIAHDGQTIAWTETSGAPTALVTVTYVAGINGEDQRQVFSDGARDGIRAYPVAFNSDKTLLYMDYQPNTIGDLTPFRQYAGLFSLNLSNGETSALPGEPGCFCGAGIDAGIFLRLTVADGGFNLRIRSLTNSTETMLAPVNSFTQGGDVLIAPDGTRAVYALAQISGFGTASQSVQTVIVLVDLLHLSQQPLGAPTDRLLRPIMWTEDDSAILFADPMAQTTWKATVSDGTLDQIANGVYLGTVVSG
ncbi:MAG: hypothetical protein ABI835_08265, partial [Chloroflexota bacterium]